jgi:hypothetical protein
VRVGLFRPITLWPFPIDALRGVVGRARRLVVVEASEGQLEDELRLALSHAGWRRPRSVTCAAQGGVLPSQAEMVVRDLLHVPDGAPSRRAPSGRSTLMPSPVFYRQFERHDHGLGPEGAHHHLLPGLWPRAGPEVPRRGDRRARRAGPHDRSCHPSAARSSRTTGSTSATPRRRTAGRPRSGSATRLANPDSIVICYQGDGDLASIGLAEIISAAQLGMPMTVIFVNNAIYGMTGGQMAPTTLVGQSTTTTPAGRTPFAGQPLKVAEMIAGLDGPVFVERVALYDNRHRTHAKRRSEGARSCRSRAPGSRWSKCSPSARST